MEGAPSSFLVNPTSSQVKVEGEATIQIDTGSLFALAGSYIQIRYPAAITASNIGSSAVSRASLAGVIVTGSSYSVSNN